MPEGATLCRVAPREALVIGGGGLTPAGVGMDEGAALIEDVTDGWAAFELTGDDAPEAFARLSELDLPARGSSKVTSSASAPRSSRLPDVSRSSCRRAWVRSSRSGSVSTARSCWRDRAATSPRVPQPSSAEAAVRRGDRGRGCERPLVGVPPRRVPRDPRRRGARASLPGQRGQRAQHAGRPRHLQHDRDRAAVRNVVGHVPDALAGARLQRAVQHPGQPRSVPLHRHPSGRTREGRC